MTIALLSALILVNVLYVLHLERKDRRHDAQVNRLLVHVQAPEVAVMEHQQAAAVDLPAVNPMEDDDYWQAQEEALARIRQMEAS